MGSVKHYFRSPINHQSLRNSRALVKNENFDTREFILFISRKKWVRSILRPLLELCAFDDRYYYIMDQLCAEILLVHKVYSKTSILITALLH